MGRRIRGTNCAAECTPVTQTVCRSRVASENVLAQRPLATSEQWVVLSCSKECCRHHVKCGRPLAEGGDVRALPRGPPAARPSPALRAGAALRVSALMGDDRCREKIQRLIGFPNCDFEPVLPSTKSSNALYASLTRGSKPAVMDATHFCVRAMKVCFA
jgi:hypothetical protein